MKTKSIKAGWVEQASLPCTLRLDGIIMKATSLKRDLDYTTFRGTCIMPPESRGQEWEAKVDNGVYVLIW